MQTLALANAQLLMISLLKVILSYGIDVKFQLESFEGHSMTLKRKCAVAA